MVASKTQLLANARYREKAYDALNIFVKKGKKDFYKDSAAKLGISLSALIQKGVEEYIEKNLSDKEKN